MITSLVPDCRRCSPCYRFACCRPCLGGSRDNKDTPQPLLSYSFLVFSDLFTLTTTPDDTIA